MPEFETEKEARAWLVEDAIAEATAPYLAILTEAGHRELCETLEDAAETHPILRVFAKRAAKALLPTVETPPLRAAARRPGKDDALDTIAKVPPPKLRDAALEGMPDLKKAEYYDAAIGIIKSLANAICEKSRVPVKGPFRDDLVQEGWISACEVCKTWDSTKSAFPTFLWRCARARMIDVAKKGSSWRDTPAGCFLDTMQDPEKDRKTTEPVRRFREAMNSAAASFALGWTEHDSPEEALARVRDRDAVRRCVATLEPRAQNLLKLVYVDEMKVAPAGASLGMPESTARLVHETALTTVGTRIAETSNVVPLRRRARPS